MTSYETEHNITTKKLAEPPRRRPDLSTFLASYDQIDTSQTQNINAQPTPADIAAATRNLAEWFERMRQDNGGEGGAIDGILDQLWQEYNEPPRNVKGVSETFLADLDRVPKKLLKKSDVCAICNNPFLEDTHPLVVRLPCHKTHIFDLECIEPWLKLHNTCPLDRKELEKPKAPPPPKPADEEEEEYDDMYA